MVVGCFADMPVRCVSSGLSHEEQRNLAIRHSVRVWEDTKGDRKLSGYSELHHPQNRACHSWTRQSAELEGQFRAGVSGIVAASVLFSI